jgi:hypothetical protein
MTNQTIINAAMEEVMGLRGAPMTVREIHDALVSAGLYTFNAEQPVTPWIGS